jgi:hypothetical protein
MGDTTVERALIWRTKSRLRRTSVRHLRESDSWAAILLLVVAAGAGLAQAQTNIQKSAAIACGVMSGQRKADAQMHNRFNFYC